MNSNFTVRKKAIEISLGVLCFAISAAFFILMVILYLDDPVENPLYYVECSFLFLLFGIYVFYNSLRPKITVKNGKITYYTKFRRKKEIKPDIITQKCRTDARTEMDKTLDANPYLMGGALGALIGVILKKSKNDVSPPSPPEMITYISYGKTVLNFKTTMKNADMLEAYIDSKRPQFQEISE